MDNFFHVFFRRVGFSLFHNPKCYPELLKFPHNVLVSCQISDHSVSLRLIYRPKKGKGKVRPKTSHEGLERSRGVA